MDVHNELRRAAALRRGGRFRSALESYLRVARAQQESGEFAAEATTLRQALELAPDQLQLWRDLSVAAARHRDYRTAIDAYETFLRQGWKGRGVAPPVVALVGYADLLLMARRTSAARQAIDEALAAGADDAAAHLIASRCARLEHDLPGAERHVIRALAKQPTSGEAWGLRLELASTSELADGLADACANLLESEAIGAADRTGLAYAAGRAFDRLEAHSRAFALWRSANLEQRRQQQARGLHYDRDGAQRQLQRMRAAYAGVMRPGVTPPRDASPVFIVGMPRSGTTLVERILGGLQGVVTGGENEALEVIAGQLDLDRDHGRVPGAGDMTEVHWEALAAAYWQRSGPQPCRITDKMPHNFRHVGLVRAVFPNSPVIHVRRDPRDVCLSIFAHQFPDVHTYATDLGCLAQEYALSLDYLAHWQATYPDTVLEMGFETLVADPEAQSRRLAEFCGLEWRRECLDVHKRIDVSYTFSEMQVRAPINQTGVGRWRLYRDQLEPLISELDALGVQHPATMSV